MSNTEPDRDLAEPTEETELELIDDAAGAVAGSTLDDPDDIAGSLPEAP